MAHIRCDFRSEVLDMGTSMTVFLPENLDCSTVKVVYLLHGLADNCTGWARYTRVEFYARMKNVAVVIPEVQRSYYSNMDNGLAYFRFVHEELPEICSRMFGFSSDRDKNYIMGLSMGGYGAIKSVLTSPSRFAGCASFSAVTDLASELKKKDEQRAREYKAMFAKYPELPANCDLIKLLKKSKSEDLPKFYMACGLQDGFIDQNRDFAKHLKRKGVECSFEEWDGVHGWNFWDEAVRRAFEYFFA